MAAEGTVAAKVRVSQIAHIKLYGVCQNMRNKLQPMVTKKTDVKNGINKCISILYSLSNSI